MLPGSHAGVFNPAAFTSEELIVCEAILEALLAWCAGFRHVTAVFGADGWTDQMTTAVQVGGVKRVPIGFDRDPAGDAGARKLAAVLAGVGVECFRVELPAGADVNDDVAVQAANPTQTLGRFLRSGPTARPATPSRRPHDSGPSGGSCTRVRARQVPEVPAHPRERPDRCAHRVGNRHGKVLERTVRSVPA